MKHVNKSKRGCWQWIGCKNSDGYGGFALGTGKGRELAHRTAYQLFNGVIPKGKCVLHTCDNPACVNPKHLWLGTHTDNMKDKKRKGRQPEGEENIKSILTLKQVKEIRRLYSKGGYYHRHFAEKYGVSKGAIWAIINKISWKT